MGGLVNLELDEKVVEISKELEAGNKKLKEAVKINKRAREAVAGARQYLTKLYGGCCQACGNGDKSIMELAQIKPLSQGGESTISNMLLLCPNDHRLFDMGAWSVSDDMSLIGRDGKLSTSARHGLSEEYLKWHREIVYSTKN